MEGVAQVISLMLDKERHLKFTYPAMALAERELSRVWGRKINLLTVLADGIGLNDLHVLLWAALLHEDPSMTLLRTQDVMDPARLAEMMQAVTEAWMAAWRFDLQAPQESSAPLAEASTGDGFGAVPG